MADDFNYSGSIFGNDQWDTSTGAYPATDPTQAAPAGGPLDWATPDQLQTAGLTPSPDDSFGAQLKTALGSLKTALPAAQKQLQQQQQQQPAAGQPGSAWPFGRPAAGVAKAAPGAAPPGLDSVIQTLQQRAQALQQAYLQRGPLQPRAPGGLLGM